MISSSTCLRTLDTTSSIRAGWIRPSVTNWWSARRAISRRTGSKADNTIASGVSSTTISTPVAASSARILRPSRPIMRPLISSDSMWNTVTEFSMAVSVATRCMDCITIRFASLLAVSLASSIMSLMKDWACVLASSFKDSIIRSLASSAERPEMVSSFSISCCCSLSSSSFFLSIITSWASRFSFTASASDFLRCISSWRWFSTNSRCFNLFSACWIFWLRIATSFSKSAFLFRNFSFTSSNLFFLITSASASASFRMLSYLDFKPCLKNMYDRNPPIMKQAMDTSIVTVISICFKYINKKRTAGKPPSCFLRGTLSHSAWIF